MIGRSSRKRNISEGILYCATKEKESQIIEKMKRSNFSKMQDLEFLIHVLEKRARDKELISIMKSE